MRVLPARGLVPCWSSSACFLALVFCKIENDQVRVLYAGFLRVFKENNFVLRQQKCCVWMTHMTKKTSWWFLIIKLAHKFRCRRVADDEFPACVTCHGLLRMTKQTKSYSSSFSFSGLRLLSNALRAILCETATWNYIIYGLDENGRIQ